MKILTCCAGGNWRSHHLALLLKDFYHHDAIALGLATVSGQDTRRMLFEWADLIVLTTDEVNHGHVPPEFASKTVLWDVGPDTFNHPPSRELYAKHIAFLDANAAVVGQPVPEHVNVVNDLRHWDGIS